MMKVFLDTNYQNADTSQIEILSPTEFVSKYL